jgi:hypothetical protein
MHRLAGRERIPYHHCTVNQANFLAQGRDVSKEVIYLNLAEYGSSEDGIPNCEQFHVPWSRPPILPKPGRGLTWPLQLPQRDRW